MRNLLMICVILTVLSKTVTSQIIVQNNFLVIAIGNKTFPSTNSKVPSLTLDKKNLEVIEAKTFDKYVHVKKIIIKGNEVSKFQLGAFNGLDDLEELYINDEKKLTTLPNDIFKGLKNLVWLDLWRNNITYLKSGVFNGLKKLTYLDLSDNKLSNFEPGVFSGLGDIGMNLTFSLQLKYNCIILIHRGVFSGLHLSLIDFHGNQISEIESGSFSGLVVDRMILSFNRFTSINPNFFTGLIYIRELDLSNNPLIRIQKNTFAQIQPIAMLHLYSSEYELPIDGKEWGLPKSSKVFSFHFIGHTQ